MLPSIPRARQDSALAEALTAAATALHAAEGKDATMSVAVRLACQIVPGADHAGITLVDRGTRARTAAWTSEAVAAADAAEQPADVNRPPFWHRLWDHPVVQMADTADPAGSALAALGLRSTLSLRLSVGYRRLSMLNLFGSRPRAFTEEAVRTGRLLAAHVAIALDSASTREQLTEAMHTRDVIGQATGILMARLDLDAREAFARLVRASQQENVKVRDIASRVVDAVAGKNGNRPEGVG